MRIALLLLATLVPVRSFAQTGFADLVDHIHLAAPDQAKAVEWYRAHFGAEPTPEGPDRAMLGTTRLGSSRVDLQACKLEYSIVSPK